MARIDPFLQIMQQSEASDLHLSDGVDPMLRINGVLERAKHRADQHLTDMINDDIVTIEEAIRYASDPDNMTKNKQQSGSIKPVRTA